MFKNRKRIGMPLFTQWHNVEGVDGEGGGGGGTGSGASEDVFTKEDIEAAVNKAIEPYLGLQTKNEELMNDLKKSQKHLKQFEGVDIDKLRALQHQVENDEILRLMSEGKSSEAIEKATEKMQVTHQAELQKLQEALESTQTEAQSNAQLVQSLLVDGGAKQAFIEAGGVKTAQEDVASRAREIWQVENGEPVARDGNGNIIQGKEGPLTMSEWVAALKETAPHLFPPSEGGGMGGGEGGEGGSSLEAQILAATARGDFAKLRELRQERDKRRSTR